jgi:hypothetical protein
MQGVSAPCIQLWLVSLSDRLVIECVSRKDDKVQTLLRNKEDKIAVV